jgi:lipopolysaccharide transport system permease protein
MSSEVNEPAITVIAPPRGWALPNLREVWHYRGVLFNAVQRNFKVIYRQTIGGPLYAVYNPLMTMIGYNILLGSLLQVSSEGIPYPVFSFSALIIWTLFTQTLQDSSISLQTNSALIQKIYIPHLIFPLVSTAMAFVNFLIAFVLLVVIMLSYGILPTWNVLWLPLFIVIAMGCGLGIGLWFAGLHARFRDTQYVVGLITRLLFFLTPVVYSSREYPAPWDQIYQLNPMSVVVEGFRWALLGTGEAPRVESVLISLALTLVFLVGGALYFKRLEPTIADVI